MVWDIKEDANVANEGQCLGTTHTKSSTLFIDPDQPLQGKEITLLHEMIHAILWQCGLDKDLGIQLEEKVANLLSFSLRQIIQDNDFLNINIE